MGRQANSWTAAHLLLMAACCHTGHLKTITSQLTLKRAFIPSSLTVLTKQSVIPRYLTACPASACRDEAPDQPDICSQTCCRVLNCAGQLRPAFSHRKEAPAQPHSREDTLRGDPVYRKNPLPNPTGWKALDNLDICKNIEPHSEGLGCRSMCAIICNSKARASVLLSGGGSEDKTWHARP